MMQLFEVIWAAVQNVRISRLMQAGNISLPDKTAEMYVEN